MRNGLKVIGLVLAAALLISAFASAAQANTKFTAGSYPVTGIGTQTTQHSFTIGGNRTVKCANATFHGTLTAAATDITITPTYSNCKIKIPTSEGELDATVTMNSCHYTFTEPSLGVGAVDILCPGGALIVIEVYNGTGVAHSEANRICRFTVAAQGPRNSLTYTNVGATVIAHANVTGIEVTKTAGTIANCGATNQTATYLGSTELKDVNEKISLSVDQT